MAQGRSRHPGEERQLGAAREPPAARSRSTLEFERLVWVDTRRVRGKRRQSLRLFEFLALLQRLRLLFCHRLSPVANRGPVNRCSRTRLIANGEPISGRVPAAGILLQMRLLREAGAVAPPAQGAASLNFSALDRKIQRAFVLDPLVHLSRLPLRMLAAPPFEEA